MKEKLLRWAGFDPVNIIRMWASVLVLLALLMLFMIFDPKLATFAPHFGLLMASLNMSCQELRRNVIRAKWLLALTLIWFLGACFLTYLRPPHWKAYGGTLCLVFAIAMFLISTDEANPVRKLLIFWRKRLPQAEPLRPA